MIAAGWPAGWPEGWPWRWVGLVVMGGGGRPGARRCGGAAGQGGDEATGRPGFEPGLTEPKSAVLPLHHRPKFSREVGRAGVRSGCARSRGLPSPVGGSCDLRPGPATKRGASPGTVPGEEAAASARGGPSIEKDAAGRSGTVHQPRWDRPKSRLCGWAGRPWGRAAVRVRRDGLRVVGGMVDGREAGGQRGKRSEKKRSAVRVETATDRNRRDRPARSLDFPHTRAGSSVGQSIRFTREGSRVRVPACPLFADDGSAGPVPGPCPARAP